MTTARDALIDALNPLLGPGWPIMPAAANLDVLQSSVVLIRQQRITQHPAAPNAAHLVEFVVTLVASGADPASSEESVDDLVVVLTHDLDTAGILWTSADKVQYADRYVAYDINVQLESRKE